MEYAQSICGDSICDDDFIKYVGYTEDNACIRKYYSPETRKIISAKITELLEGVHPEGKKIIVGDNVICGMMSSIKDSYRPPTGDIYTRYIVPSGITPQDYVQSMINQVIEVITNTIKTEYAMEECNRNLTVWDTVLGDFNARGLRSHSQIKVREKKIPSALFFMNY